MCDLYGLSCNHEDRATISLKQFAKETSGHSNDEHSKRHNNDGWGIAFFDNDHAIVKRASDDEVEIPAKENEKFYQVVEKAKSKNIIRKK